MDIVLSELRSLVLALHGPTEAARIVDLVQRGHLGPNAHAARERIAAGWSVDASGHWVPPTERARIEAEAETIAAGMNAAGVGRWALQARDILALADGVDPSRDAAIRAALAHTVDGMAL